jgi:hypothetical protein
LTLAVAVACSDNRGVAVDGVAIRAGAGVAGLTLVVACSGNLGVAVDGVAIRAGAIARAGAATGTVATAGARAGTVGTASARTGAWIGGDDASGSEAAGSEAAGFGGEACFGDAHRRMNAAAIPANAPAAIATSVRGCNR